MSGRETVRSFRENAGLSRPPRMPEWTGTVLFGAVAMAVAIAAFFAVTFVLPLHPTVSVGPVEATVDPSFARVQKTLKPATGPTPARRSGVAQAAMTPAESKACSQRANDAGKRAITSDIRSRSTTTVIEYLSGAAQTAAFVQCLGSTRPPRLCEASERDSFIFFAQASATRYDGAVKLTGVSDDDIRSAQQKDAQLARMSIKAIRADFARALAAQRDALKSVQQTVFALTGAGIIPVDELTAHLGFGSYNDTWRAMVASAPRAESTCSSV